MKKILAILLAAFMIISVAACGDSDKDSGASSADTQASVIDDDTAKGPVSESKAIDLAIEQAKMDFQNEDIKVDGNSGRILDQNDSAYIVGLDISDEISGNYMYIEAYWVSKKSGETKDVCSINEYYDGLIDVTNGEPLF